jgi:hypothetical protein
MTKYTDAIEWIALNDEPTLDEVEEVAGLISVCLVADVWKKEPREVAAAVVRYRLKEDV